MLWCIGGDVAGMSKSMRRCEYPEPTELEGISGRYFRVPASIILDKNAGSKRVTAFSYFSVRRGLDDKVDFSINGIAKWTGKKPNRNPNGVNSQLAIVLDYLSEREYVSFSEKPNNSSYVEAEFNMRKVSEECDEYRFATIYLDELYKILRYENESGKDRFVNNDILLLVFAYLKTVIQRRSNKLLPEEDDDIEARRKRLPEAYDCYYRDIAEELGISTSRIVSKAVSILNDLGLIFSEPLPRIKVDGKWRTDHTLFCNAYKREGKYLLDYGNGYHTREMNNKKLKLDKLKNSRLSDYRI